MSLKDTIRGAREEAEASGNPFERKKAVAEVEESVEVKNAKRRATGSVASAKPRREAAAGVRVVSSSGKTTKGKSEMTKEERKAERNREREKEDRRYSLTQAYLEEDEDYKAAHKTWWIFLGAGIALVVVAFTLYGLVNQQGAEASPVMAFLALASMVLAYVAIIGGLIYDWVKIRPLRQKITKRVESMSDKRVKTILNQKAREQAEEERRKARKAQAKSR